VSDSVYDSLSRAVRDARPVALATIIEGPGTGATMLVAPAGRVAGTLGDDELDRVVARDAAGELEAGRSGVRNYGPQGQSTPEDLADAAAVRVFVESFSPPPEMWIFGAVDFTAALARVAKVLGYRVTVCDARPIFATTKRFPDADEVVVDWPHRWLEKQHVDPRTVIAVLTHDPKFDVPALKVAVGTDAGYIGAMGSRRTHDNRVIRLKEAGLTDDEISRIHSPIGLDLGARTPEETAISIAAEIVQARWGGSGEHLTRTSGPIHPGVER